MTPRSSHIFIFRLLCSSLLLVATLMVATAQTRPSGRSMGERPSGAPSSATDDESTRSSKKKDYVVPSTAWELLEPLGLHEAATIDTLLYNYYRQSIPSQVSNAYASTGNLGAEGLNMLFFERKPMSDFFFRDALRAWLPQLGQHKFYNTGIPMTLMSYNTSGGRDNEQSRLQADFSGNFNARAQIGAMLDYLYSKGSYEYQAVKNLTWGLSGSYMGDRYEMQTFFNHYNSLNKENGGITDDLYITNPAVLQGGTPTINPKSIPTRLTAAHNRLRGEEFYLNQRYKVGYWHEEPPSDSIPGDTLPHYTYIPVSSFIWTLNYIDSKHKFLNTSASEGAEFWENHYLSATGTDDSSEYSTLTNTFGISLLEGFHKYAKAGLAAYITHQLRRYTQPVDSIPISGADRPEDLTPYPLEQKLAHKTSQNLVWVGAQLTKQRGTLLRYDITGQIGIAGPVAADVRVDGKVMTRLPLLGDSIDFTWYGTFSNEEAPFLTKEYVSNHFIWQNDFGKVRRLRLGGELTLPWTKTYLNVGVENLQNYIYFGPDCTPVQKGGNVQVFSATLRQNLRAGVLHWNNTLTYQTSSDDAVIPLPKLAVYSNLFLLFKVAGVLDVQFGVDCDYYTRYYAPGYQPATMSFYNQRTTEVGNYPFMNVYANMKLSKTRFYVLFSHVNQGMGDKNYFALPHYPMNPRRFQIGLSIDFSD
ncbi:MAG: putative porin [Bacteroidales bacterium]|nr:putative porin [Bacteroidales bacterium]